MRGTDFSEDIFWNRWVGVNGIWKLIEGEVKRFIKVRLERILILEQRIEEVTLTIFLRELRGIWEKANPLPTDLVLGGAKHLESVSPKSGKEQSLPELKNSWEKNKD
jgi:hypothetical protein